jgi:hypothetical protein
MAAIDRPLGYPIKYSYGTRLTTPYCSEDQDVEPFGGKKWDNIFSFGRPNFSDCFSVRPLTVQYLTVLKSLFSSCCCPIWRVMEPHLENYHDIVLLLPKWDNNKN